MVLSHDKANIELPQVIDVIYNTGKILLWPIREFVKLLLILSIFDGFSLMKIIGLQQSNFGVPILNELITKWFSCISWLHCMFLILCDRVNLETYHLLLTPLYHVHHFRIHIRIHLTQLVHVIDIQRILAPNWKSWNSKL